MAGQHDIGRLSSASAMHAAARYWGQRRMILRYSGPVSGLLPALRKLTSLHQDGRTTRKEYDRMGMEQVTRENRLRELRERSRLTQKEVAKLLDIDHTTVSKHESGDRNLSPDDIRKYAGLYKVETFELFVDPSDLAKDGGTEGSG